MIKSLALLGLMAGCFSAVAHADVVLIANQKLPADSIDKNLISNVYLGKAFALPDGTRLIPLERPKDLEIKEEFHSHITGKSLGQLNSYWSRLIFTGKNAPPNEVDEDEDVIELIVGNENLIGYVDSSSVTDAIKVVYRVTP